MDEHFTPNPPDPGEINRDVLNNVTLTALQPGYLFGKDFDLTEQDREQIALAKSKAEEILSPSYEDTDWKAFMTLVEEGDKKGVLMSFVSHEDTFVPTWCVNGGPNAQVKKIRAQTEHGERPGIEVPQKIFEVFDWKNAEEGLERYLNSSNETLKGTQTKDLGLRLKHLAKLVGSNPSA